MPIFKPIFLDSEKEFWVRFQRCVNWLALAHAWLSIKSTVLLLPAASLIRTPV